MSELQRGLLPLFFGQLLFQSFLFCLTLLYPFRDPFRRLTLTGGRSATVRTYFSIDFLEFSCFNFCYYQRVVYRILNELLISSLKNYEKSSN